MQTLNLIFNFIKIKKKIYKKKIKFKKIIN